MNIKVVAKTVLINPSGEILLLMRSQTDSRRPGQWDFPGGNVEDGELIEVACMREIKEEANIVVDDNNLQLFWADADAINSDVDHTTINIVWLFYRAKVTNADPQLSYEHDMFQWMKPAEALKIITYQRHADMLSYALKYQLLEP
jgi:8-oxo-dGTP diphosphatase